MNREINTAIEHTFMTTRDESFLGKRQPVTSFYVFFFFFFFMQSHVKQRETFKEEDTSCDMFGITAGAFDPQVVTHKRQVNKFKLCSVHKRENSLPLKSFLVKNILPSSQLFRQKIMIFRLLCRLLTISLILC